MLTTRQLPPEEWHRILDQGIEPFATHGLPGDPSHWRLVVAEEDGVIVGLSGLYEAVHNDPWWVAPAYRGHPTILRRLWQEVRSVLDEHDVRMVFATVADDQPDVQQLAERFGFEPAPGRLYLLTRCTVAKE